jgi:hypothetical protein
LKKLLDMGKKQTSQIPNILLSVKDASVAISVSSKMVRLLIASGRLKAVNLGKRMTRISLQELTDFAQGQGCNVVLPSSSLPFNNKRREKKKRNATAKSETGSINKNMRIQEVAHRAAGETMMTTMRRIRTIIDRVGANNYGKKQKYTLER